MVALEHLIISEAILLWVAMLKAEYKSFKTKTDFVGSKSNIDLCNVKQASKN